MQITLYNFYYLRQFAGATSISSGHLQLLCAVGDREYLIGKKITLEYVARAVRESKAVDSDTFMALKFIASTSVACLTFEIVCCPMLIDICLIVFS